MDSFTALVVMDPVTVGEMVIRNLDQPRLYYSGSSRRRQAALRRDAARSYPAPTPETSVSFVE
jgi:hypothetical protein